MSIAKKKSLFFLPHNHCAKESLISCVCVCVCDLPNKRCDSTNQLR